MVIIRPVSPADLEQLVNLASLAGVGLTTLPKDRALLSKRIAKSQSAFTKFPERPSGESYLLVMEDIDTHAVVGACGIVSKVGGFEPFYGYHIETSLFESKVINVRKEVPILRLVEDHDGPGEIGSLFLHPEYRKHGNGKLLQLVRFALMAEHPDSFEANVLSEIRGYVDANGQSPFWNALGRHFFGIDFAEADRLSVVNKKFIADLMPDHPIYIPLLPKDAQDVIGKPHPDSERAVRNLQEEGFKFCGMVDIFDAGPVLSCLRDEIRTVKQSRRGVIAQITDADFVAATFMICTTTEKFRAYKSPLMETDGQIRIPRASADALGLGVGDPIRYVELHSPTTQPAAQMQQSTTS